jgi:transposase
MAMTTGTISPLLVAGLRKMFRTVYVDDLYSSGDAVRERDPNGLDDWSWCGVEGAFEQATESERAEAMQRTLEHWREMRGEGEW